MATKMRRLNREEVEAVRAIIRKVGIRATPARISALLELRAATSPLTHADLSDRLVPLGFDKATVFRNLNDLTEGVRSQIAKGFRLIQEGRNCRKRTDTLRSRW